MSAGTIQILGIVLIFVILYMLMIRPQRKKERAVNEMRNSLKVGDEITTIGGIKAKIVNVKDETLVIKVGADNVKLEVTRWAVSRVDNAVAGNKSDNTKPAEKTEKKEEEKKPEPKKPKKLGAVSTSSEEIADDEDIEEVEAEEVDVDDIDVEDEDDTDSES